MNTSVTDKVYINIVVPIDIELENESLRLFRLDLTGFTGLTHEAIYKEAKVNERFTNCIYDFIFPNPFTHYEDMDALYLERFLDGLDAAINSIDWKTRLKKMDIPIKKPNKSKAESRVKYTHEIISPFKNVINPEPTKTFYDVVVNNSKAVRHQLPTEEVIDEYDKAVRRTKLSTFIEYMTRIKELYGDGYVVFDSEYDENFKYLSISERSHRINEEGNPKVIRHKANYFKFS